VRGSLRRRRGSGVEIATGVAQGSRKSRELLLCELVREKREGERAPGEIGGGAESLDRGRDERQILRGESVERSGELLPPRRTVEIGGEAFRRDPWHGPWGSPQYEYLLSVTLDDVYQGKLPLETAIRLLSENSARLIGVYPQKGAVQVGSDADLVLVDLGREVVPSDEATYTKSHWTPYRGRRLHGAPLLTMLRGKVIAKDGKVTGNRGYGKYVAGVPQEPVEGRRIYSPGLDFRPVAGP